jgi:hypothetical protein
MFACFDFGNDDWDEKRKQEERAGWRRKRLGLGGILISDLIHPLTTDELLTLALPPFLSVLVESRLMSGMGEVNK